MNPIVLVLVLVLVLETKRRRIEDEDENDEEDEGAGSWRASFRFCARIGTMNRCASQRRGPDGGSATRSLLGSRKAYFRFFACSGTMNQIGTPLPALSPQGGERVAEGRERGGSWESWEEIGQIS